MFGGLGLQGQPDGSSVISTFEGLFNEEITVPRKAILEEGSSLQPLRQGGSLTAQIKKTGERPGSDWGAIATGDL